MKNIVWLIPTLNPSNGGPLRVPLAIVPQLQVLGLNIQIISIFTKYSLQTKYVNSCNIYIVSSLAKLLISLHRCMKSFMKIIISDTIIVSGLWSPLLILLYTKSVIFHSKLIVRTCGMLSPYYYKQLQLRHKVALALYTLPILRSSRVYKVCNSRRELLLLKPFRISNCTYIENPGFTCSRQSHFTSEQFSTRYRARKVVFFSRLHPAKGLHIAIKAANLAMHHLSSLEFYIVGPQSSPDYFNDCVRLIQGSLMPNNFKILPPIYSECEKVQFLSSCSCLLHPTFAEGFPNSVIECLSLSLPVLTTRESNISHSLRKQVGISINHDPYLISQSLIYLLTNADFYHNLSAEAGRVAESLFSPFSVATKYAKLLE